MAESSEPRAMPRPARRQARSLGGLRCTVPTMRRQSADAPDPDHRRRRSTVRRRSVLAAYSYGRFVRRAPREPSSALPRRMRIRVSAGKSPPSRPRHREERPRHAVGNLDAFAARALAARGAGRSLDLMYYIWHSDLTGRLLAHEVIRAADRGVRVRLLLDDINAHGRDPVYLALDSHPNVEVRLFNPSRARKGALRRGLEMALRAFSATRRMHNKAWIADGRLAIVGGRNIGDEYFDAAERANFRDLDLMMVGPVVRQAEDVFDAYWNSASAIPIGRWPRQRPRPGGPARAALGLGRERGGPALSRPHSRTNILLGDVRRWSRSTGPIGPRSSPIRLKRPLVRRAETG